MNETERLVENIVEGIRERKGQNISVADLTGIEDTICKYLVICQGNSPTQVEAIKESVEDYVRENTHVKPIGTEGSRNAIWIVMDYADVMVHIFVPDAREFYDIDHLWEDAIVRQVEDEA